MVSISEFCFVYVYSSIYLRVYKKYQCLKFLKLDTVPFGICFGLLELLVRMWNCCYSKLLVSTEAKRMPIAFFVLWNMYNCLISSLALFNFSCDITFYYAER